MQINLLKEMLDSRKACIEVAQSWRHFKATLENNEKLPTSDFPPSFLLKWILNVYDFIPYEKKFLS